MGIKNKIECFFMLRRADAVLRQARNEKAKRDYLNRPHVQSDHMIGYFRQIHVFGDPEKMEIPKYYFIMLAVLFFVFILINVFRG